MTKQEIVSETVEFYSQNPTENRAVTGSTCSYNGDNGTHCAFGRCMLPEYKNQGDNLKGNKGTTLRDLPMLLEVNSLDSLLEEKYRGHDESFWVQMQKLHDSNRYWDDGLSEVGKIYVEYINETLS
jgi:hypothetical protein